MKGEIKPLEDQVRGKNVFFSQAIFKVRVTTGYSI
jgi:hypothetical protein